MPRSDESTSNDHLAGLIGRVEKQVATLTQTVQGNGTGGGLVTQVALLTQGQKTMGRDVKAISVSIETSSREIKTSLETNSGRRWQFWGPVAASMVIAIASIVIAVMK